MNDALKNLIRPHYVALEGYVSAGMEVVKDGSKAFMNANENPFELPGLVGLSRYPQPQPTDLLEAYAGLYNVTPDNIVATRGADEAIVVLSHLFCEPHQDAIVICPPTFGMYARDADALPAEIVEVPLIKQGESFILDSEKIINAAKDERVKLVYLCSPNNPTGNLIPAAEIENIAHKTDGHAAIVVDETYIEFADTPSMTSVMDNHPNLIVLRTLSKSYALAGARMGCLIAADTDFIALVRAKCLDAYPLPTPSIEAALKVMEPGNLKLAEENRAKLLAERDRLFTHFSAAELVEHIYPSDTNFLLVKMRNAKEFLDHCTAQNIILRDFSDKPLTEHCIRISPGTPEQNDELIKQLMSFEKLVEAGSAA